MNGDIDVTSWRHRAMIMAMSWRHYGDIMATHGGTNMTRSPLTHTGRTGGQTAEFGPADRPQTSTSLAAFAAPFG